MTESAARPKTLTLGYNTNNSGTISVPGQQDRFTFAGAAGQRLYLDWLDARFDGLSAALILPSGAVLAAFHSSTDFGPFYLNQSGTHTLILQGDGDRTGDYAFALVDTAGALPLTFNVTVTNVLSPQSAALFYSFTGTNGQRIFATNISASSATGKWSVVSPSGRVAFDSPIRASPGEVTLPETGVYLVVFAGTNGAAGTLSFQSRMSLVSEPTGALSGFGTVFSGTLMANQTNTFSYTAPAGTLVYFDALTNSSPVNVCLYDPTGHTVFCLSDGAEDGGPHLLPLSGTYRLDVVGQSIAGYRFRLLELNGNTTPIAFGTNNSQTISPDFRTDIYRFTGTPGLGIYYDSLLPTFSLMEAHLISPSGNVVSWSGTAADDAGPFTLSEPGQYLLTLESFSPVPGVLYSFRLLEMNQNPVAALALDTTVNGLLNPATSVDCYRFEGIAGQRLFFDGTAINPALAWSLHSPGNDTIGGAAALADFEQSLPQNGTYILRVRGTLNQTNRIFYSFRVRTSESATNALSVGAVYSGTFAELGQQARYAFSGTAGQWIYYDALATGGDLVALDLLDPVGNAILLGGNAGFDAGPYVLLHAGTYTLVLRSFGDSPGAYQFRLSDLAGAAQALSLNSIVNGVLNPGTAANWYRFTGTNGQRLYFDAATTNGLGTWNLYGPGNQSLGGNTLSGDFETKLSLDGTYFLGVARAATNPIAYSIRVVAPGTPTTAYALGSSVTNSLTEPGEEQRYIFSGTPGQRSFYDALQDDFEAFNVSLIDPGGNALWSTNANLDFGFVTLRQAGTYTLLFTGTNATTGAFGFRLLDLAAAPGVTYGTIVTGQLNPRLRTDLYRIAGTAGQRISVTNISAGSTNASWRLVGLNNDTILSANIQDSLGVATLPVTGTYAIVVNGTSNSPGSLDYQFRVSLLASSNGVPMGFGMIRSGTTTAGQTNAFSYTGTVGMPIYFDNLTNAPVACYQLLGPDGDEVFNICPSGDEGIFFLPTNGTYTLNVIGSDVGGFRFRLVNLASSTAASLTFGTTYSRTLNPGFSTDFYRFTATNGQRLVYDSLQATLDSVNVRIYDSSGVNVFLNDNADVENGVFTATQPGPYYLVLENYSDDPTADYSFRLIDVNQSPAGTLAFNTQINGTLNPGTRSDVYRFTGTIGQHLYFAGNPSNTFVLWTLYGPGDLPIAANDIDVDFDSVLAQAGQYMLVIGSGVETSSAAYSVRVVTATDTTNSYTIGDTVTGDIGGLGNSRSYTFAAEAGQRLYYDALDFDLDGINVRLSAPSGATVFEHNADEEGAPFTVAETGSYTLRFSFAGNTNDFSFRLLDAAGAPVLPYGVDITNRITNSFGAALYDVAATPNLRLFFDQLGTSNTNVFYSFYDPQNTALASTNAANDIAATPMHVGTHLLVFNSLLGTATNAFKIVPGNHAPVLGPLASRSVNEGETLTFAATATDFEAPNDTLTFSLDPAAPVGANINPASGVFSWTPSEAQGPNVYSVTVRVRDDGLPPFEDAKTFSITVNEVNRVPVLNVSNQTVNELATLNLTLDAFDSDQPTNTLIFELLAGPAGLGVSSAGALQWTPTEVQGPSTNAITVRIFDNGVPILSVTQSFQVVVAELNSTPIFTPLHDRVIHLGLSVNFTAMAFDSDLPTNLLSFGLVSAPVGSAITTAGEFSWTPTNTQNASVVVRVFDSGTPSLSATQTFMVDVEPPPIFAPLVISNSSAFLSWSAITGLTYRLQHAPNLNGTNWNDFGGDVLSTGTNATQVHPSVSNLSNGFYRVRVQP